jgi:septum formation protein
MPVQVNSRAMSSFSHSNPLTAKRLYLASQSPRRLELLRQAGLEPTVLPLRTSHRRMEVDETPLPDEAATDYVLRLARLKAETGAIVQTARNLPLWPVLAADTTVTLDGHIIGKPTDANAGAAMLRLYSGRTHTVLTAVAAIYLGRFEQILSASQVTFKTLSESEIAAYLATREGCDKAGGYGIQGRAALFIEHIAGSYSGVMGLPLYETAELLKSLGYEIL